MSDVCGLPCEVYSRVVGFLRPVDGWNKGKKAEWSERVPFEPEIEVDGDLAASMAAELLNHLHGHKSEDVHQEADSLRTGGHEMAGEILEMLITMRDYIMDPEAVDAALRR